MRAAGADDPMWKKRIQSPPEEAGVRIPDAPDRRGIPDEWNEVHVESVRKKARRQIVFTALMFVALFAGMTVFFCRYAILHKSELFDNDYNSRDLLLEEHNRRGRILAAGGEELAYSDEDNNRYYPYNNLFCHAVGFSALGGSGIEVYMKYELLHADIPFSSKLECDREEIRYPGNDVTTTLDLDLQSYA